MVMLVGAFYLVVYTLLVVDGSNRVVGQQGDVLGDYLTDEEIAHLEDLVDRKSLSMEWIDNVFIPRLTEELTHLDWLESRWRDINFNDPKYARHRDTYERERASVLDWAAKRRINVFARALDPNIFQRAETELQNAYRALLTGEVGNRWKRYLKEEGPVGVARDVGKSIVTFIPRGIATTARTFSEGGFGEHPMKSLAEISVAIPSVIALVRLILRILRQSVLPFIFSIPKVLWNFILDRVRELGRAVRGEE